MVERQQQIWTRARNVPPVVLSLEDERAKASLRELRAYPFFSHGGDTFDRLSSFAAEGENSAADQREAERLSLSVALCQSHAKVRAIEKLLNEALEALHDPSDNTPIPSALSALLRDTGQQLVALGHHFHANE
jgi:hypothetical protein